MGRIDRIRATLGSLEALPSLNRRLLATESAVQEHAVRIDTLTHQVEQLHNLLEQIDPQGTHDIVLGVRDSVRQLSIELTEQANQTSDLLSELSESRP